jgi:hypothetical protein
MAAGDVPKGGFPVHDRQSAMKMRTSLDRPGRGLIARAA